MSSSSELEDDETMVQLLKATDASFLTNAMFKEKFSNPDVDESASKNTLLEVVAPTNDEPKSQRYLDETDTNIGTDILLPETVKQHFSKKLSHIIEKQIEFCHHAPNSLSQKKQKSKVRLLPEADCYVKSYEEFEYDFKGPGKKPNIKRRRLSEENELSEKQKLAVAAVNAKDIINGSEVKNWAKKPEKQNKIFYYNKLHAKEKITEFTKMRQKNKWNESKIKQKK